MVKKENKSEIYDVIIVGAGIAGLTLAKFLNDSKLKVLLVEKRSTIKKLENYRYGTFMKTIKRYKLKKYLIKKYRKLAFGTSEIDKQTVFSYSKDALGVVDMNLFARDLELTCDVITSVKIKNIIINDEEVLLKTQKGNYSSKIIADCSGHSQVTSKFIENSSKDSSNFLNTMFELSHCNFPEEIQDKVIFPQYKANKNMLLWLYPYTKTKGQFGQADIFAKKFPVEENGMEVLKNIMKQEPYKKWFKNAKIDDKLQRVTPTTLKEHVVKDRLIICGDAAGATTPALGEGFRISLNMAEQAYKTILVAYKKDDFTTNTLRDYEKWLYKKYGKYYRASKIMIFLLLRYIHVREYNLFSKNLKKLDKQESLSFLLSKITWGMFFKLVTPKLMLMMFQNAFKYHLLGKR